MDISQKYWTEYHTYCDLSYPIKEPMNTIKHRMELFHAKTKKEKSQIMFKALQELNFFSNMDDEERETYKQLESELSS